MEQNNLYKKLRFMALCLAIVCMVLSLIKRAKASVPEDDYNNIISFINENNGNSTVLINNWNDINYTSSYYVILPNTNGGTLIGYRIYFFQDNYIIPEGDNNSGANIRFYNWYFCYPSNNIGGTQWYYDFIIGSNNCLLNRCAWRNPAGTSFTYNNMTYVENNGYEGTIENTLSSSQAFRLNLNTISNYNCYSNLETFGFCADNTNPYSTVDLSQYLIAFDNNIENTDGLKVYKQTIHNQNYLYIDYSDLQNIAPTYLETSVVFGNIDVDGTIFEIDYDSSSQYYHINLSTGKVYYQIPFGSLDIDDENIESAVLTDLEINVSWSTTLNNGENVYYWVKPIYLIGTPHDVDGYTPDSSSEQPAQTYTPEMNAEYYLNIYSMYYNGHTGDPFVYNDNINIFSSHQNALDSIKLLADVLEMDTWYTSSTTKELWASNTDLFGDYIYDNGYGLYYDAIVFDVYDRHVDGVINPVNVYKGTGVLLTERYYTRNGLMTCTDSLKDIITYDKMCSDYLYLLYDVTWKKLKSIDYNTSDYFTKQGTLTNQIIMLLENINSFLPDINGLLNDILNALKNLQLSQLDAIDNKLSTIVDNITGAQPFNEDDTIAEAIAYYTTHTQTEAVIQDKYSVWFTGYCHYWLQEYNTQQTRNITVDTSVSDNRRKYIVKTFTFCERAFNSLENADVLKYIDEMFQYLMVQHNNPNAEPRKHFFEDIFDTANYSTLDYNPYE